MYYKYHKINWNFRVSYVDSPDRITNEKVTINPINKKYKTIFAETDPLNDQEIGKHAERITKIKPFTN